MLSQTLSLYRRHFGVLVLTCALALLPANLLAVGAVTFGLASLGSAGMAEARTQAQQIQKKQRDLEEKPPATAEDRDARARQIGREAVEGGAAPTFDPRQYFRNLVPIAYTALIFAAILLAGLFLAHAALVPLLMELEAGRRAGPAYAWAVAGARIGALLWTGFLAAVLVGVGAACFFLPGIALAAGFSIAAPIVVRERISGRAALERSWRLIRCHWGTALGYWALIVLFSVIASGVAAKAPPGPWQPFISALIRVILYPLPLVGLVLLYQRSINTSAGARRPGSSAQESLGSPPP